MQRVLLRRTGRPVIRRSARGQEEVVLVGPGRVSGELWGDAEVAVLSPDASPPVPVEWP